MLLAILFWLTLFEGDAYNISAPREAEGVADRFVSLYQAIGVDVTIQYFPLVRAQALAESGKVDAYLFGTKELGESFPTLERVPVPVGFATVVACAKRGRFFKKTWSWKAIKKHRLGHLRGSTYLSKRTKGAKVIIEGEDQGVVMRMLAGDRVDLAIIFAHAGARTANRYGFENEVICIDPPLDRVATYHYVHKKHKMLIPMISSEISKERNIIVDEAWTMP